MNRNTDQKRRKGRREGGEGKERSKETSVWALTRFTIIFPQTKEYDTEGRSRRSLNKTPVQK